MATLVCCQRQCTRAVWLLAFAASRAAASTQPGCTYLVSTFCSDSIAQVKSRKEHKIFTVVPQ